MNDLMKTIVDRLDLQGIGLSVESEFEAGKVSTIVFTAVLTDQDGDEVPAVVVSTAALDYAEVVVYMGAHVERIEMPR